jgi:hypothetical protein
MKFCPLMKANEKETRGKSCKCSVLKALLGCSKEPWSVGSKDIRLLLKGANIEIRLEIYVEKGIGTSRLMDAL